MPYTKQTLQTLYSLSIDEVNETLKAGKLDAEREEYTDEEIQSSFDIIRGYFNEEKVKDYKQAAIMFEQQVNLAQSADPEAQAKTDRLQDDKKPTAKTLDFPELLSFAKDLLDCKIPPKEAIKLLEACGLSVDAEHYNQEECDRFLEACDMLKQQNKSYEEVAAHFGGESAKTSPTNGRAQLIELLGGSVLSADEELCRLINKITAKQADRNDIERLVQWSYLENVSRKLSDNQNNTSTLFDELEQRAMDYIEGKSPARSLQPNWDWAPNSLPSSSPKPMILPEGSENGTSGE